MNLKDSFIHMFATGNNYYIYDVNTNSILKTDKRLYDYLHGKRKDTDISDAELDIQIKHLLDKGYLNSKRVGKIEHSYTDILPQLIKNKLSTIALQVTQQCNLRCKYCMYSGNYSNRNHQDQNMTLEVAKKGIDFFIEHSSESNRLNIGFYGGEPLLRLDLIEQCVKYAREQAEGRDIHFNMTTNGTLLNEAAIEYLVENDIKLLISIDGPEEIHDKNRRFAANNKGTFRTIMNNIAKLKNKYPEYASKNVGFNAVLDPTTDFYCTNKFFCEYEDLKNFRVSASLITDQYSNTERRLEEQYAISNNYERFKYYLSKIGKLDGRYVSRLYDGEFEKLIDTIGRRKLYKCVNDKEHHGGPCIPGVSRLLMDVNGTLYPCERVSELSEHMRIGNVYEGFNIEKMLNILNIGKLTEDKCINCWAYRFCHLCAAHADDINELSRDKKLKKCPSVRYGIDDDMKNFVTLMEFGLNLDEYTQIIEVV